MTVGLPGWLSVDRDKLEGTVLADPTRDQIDTPIEAVSYTHLDVYKRQLFLPA